jgi:hypothetical protein
MLLARAADALLEKFLPKVDAAAATAAGNCYCSVRSATCKGSYIYENLYWRVTDYYGSCTIWGAFCSSRRTPERC